MNRLWALLLSEQVVVPYSIRVCTQISSMPWRANHTHIRTFSCAGIFHKEGIGFRVDTRDHLCRRPFPWNGWVTDVSDVFVRTIWMGFRDASDSDVSHVGFPIEVAPKFVPSLDMAPSEGVFRQLLLIFLLSV